jgi:hypothetical protein
MSQGSDEKTGASCLFTPIAEAFFPTYLRWIFPWYLFSLPRSVAEYREKCIHLSWFYIVINGILVAALAIALLAVPKHSFRFDFLFCLLSLAFSLSALALIKKSDSVNLAGLLVLAIAVLIPLGASVPKLLYFYSSKEIFLSALILAGDAFWIFILARFFRRGARLLVRQSD